MINPTKSTPIIYGDNGRYTTILQLIIGKDQDVEMDSPDLETKVKEFVRFVTRVIPDDFAKAQGHDVMRAWRVNENRFWEYFKKSFDARTEDTYQVRLSAVYTGLQVTWWVQWVRDEEQTVGQISTQTFGTRAGVVAPNPQDPTEKWKYGFFLEFSGDDDIFREDAEFNLNEGSLAFQDFVEATTKNFNLYAKGVYRRQRQYLQSIGTGARELSMLKPQRFDLETDFGLSRKFKQALLELTNQRNAVEGQVYLKQNLVLELQCSTTSTRNKTEIVFSGELYSESVVVTQPDNEETIAFKLFWSTEESDPA